MAAAAPTSSRRCDLSSDTLHPLQVDDFNRAVKGRNFGRNFTCLNEMIRDATFLDYLAKEEIESVVDALYKAITERKPEEIKARREFVLTVVAKCRGPLQDHLRHRCSIGPVKVVVRYLSDPPNFKPEGEDDLNELVVAMTSLQNWPVFEPLFNEKIGELKIEALSVIVAMLPLDYSKWADVIAKSIPRMAADKSVPAACGLFAMAKGAFTVPAYRPIATKLLEKWNDLTPFPVPITDRAGVEIIRELAPGRLRECFIESARLELDEEAMRLFGPIPPRELGIALLLAATRECKGYDVGGFRPRAVTRFIEFVLRHQDTSSIPVLMLKGTLGSLEKWLEINRKGVGDRTPLLRPTELLCARIRTLIAQSRTTRDIERAELCMRLAREPAVDGKAFKTFLDGISPEELGYALLVLTAAGSTVVNHRDAAERQMLIDVLLSCEAVARIPKDLLRQALISQLEWLYTNQLEARDPLRIHAVGISDELKRLISG